MRLTRLGIPRLLVKRKHINVYDFFSFISRPRLFIFKCYVFSFVVQHLTQNQPSHVTPLEYLQI